MLLKNTKLNENLIQNEEQMGLRGRAMCYSTQNIVLNYFTLGIREKAIGKSVSLSSFCYLQIVCAIVSSWMNGKLKLRKTLLPCHDWKSSYIQQTQKIMFSIPATFLFMFNVSSSRPIFLFVCLMCT